MADVYEVNCAPHNFYGHLCSCISAHFCAAIPNFRIMEIDIDSAPWPGEPPKVDPNETVSPRQHFIASHWRLSLTA